MTHEQRQYAIGAIVIVCTIAVIAMFWLGSEALR
jgi:hypothetical protein